MRQLLIQDQNKSLLKKIQILLMHITIKTKAADRQKLLKRAAMYKNDSFIISKNIKQLFEPPLANKNISIIHFRSTKDQKQNTKISLQTTASSLSTRHQSAERYRKKIVNNPEEPEKMAKQHLKDLHRKNNSYQIRWKFPISSSACSSVSKSMRVILGEWLMQLSLQLQLPKDAFYNAMHYTDKYIGIVSINRSKYQAIGLCALFIACKLELSDHPNINVFVESMDGAISKDQLISLEQEMVFKLKFRLNPPTIYQYMVLLISLFNYFLTKFHYYGFLINPCSQLHKELFWMLDGVHLQNEYKQFRNKQKVCLAILYICIKKQKCQKSVQARKKLYNELQMLKSEEEIEKIFEEFLSNVIQVFKKLGELKDVIFFYRGWVKHERMGLRVEDEIEQLKNIIVREINSEKNLKR